MVGIPHVPIVTIAGFGGFHKILSGFISPEGATLDDFRNLYQTSEMNQIAISELCSHCNLDIALFEEGTPLYYFGREPNSAPFGRTLGKHSLVTTIPSLRDPIYDTIEDEDELYMDMCGSKLVSTFSRLTMDHGYLVLLSFALAYLIFSCEALCGPDAWRSWSAACIDT